MICLFLDTSSDELTVSLVKDNKLLFEKSILTKNDHSSYLVSTIRHALDENNLSVKDINKVFVTVGPGSFTGTRIGVTVAKTLAWSLGINVVPISSLEQYIYNYKGYDYYVSIIEEKHDNLYYCIYDDKYNKICDEIFCKKDQMLENISDLTGNVLLISNENYDGYTTLNRKINSVELINNCINNEEINPHLLKPNYIKKIEVESKL